MNVSRPVMRWHGGKWMLAPWIISHFPPHKVYVEPFGGAASVLLRKPRCYAEIYNDMDGDAVNLFRVLRGPHAGELVDALRLTPFSRDEFEVAHKPATEPVERARRLVVRSFMGFGSNAHARRSGFRFNSNNSDTAPGAAWRNYPESLGAVILRLSGVVIENRPAIDVIRAHDRGDVLIYADPPYVMGTRSDDRPDYMHEMTDAAHELLDVLRHHSGMVALSGYPSQLYDTTLRGWTRIERAALADGAKKRVEVLWLNPRCAQRVQGDLLRALETKG